MPKAAAKAKAWLRLCATRRIRNIVINLISACNARQAHTVRVCVCVRVCVRVFVWQVTPTSAKTAAAETNFRQNSGRFCAVSGIAFKIMATGREGACGCGGRGKSEMSRGNIFAKQVAINLIYMYVNRRRWHPQTTPHTHRHKYTHARLVQGLEPVRTLYANIAL